MHVVNGRVPAPAMRCSLAAPRAELGVEVGGELVLERPEPRWFTVVGIGEQSAQLDTPLLVLGPGAAWTSRNPSEAPMELVDLPGTPTDTAVRAAAKNITVHGYGGVSDRTDDQERDDSTGAVRWSWVIGAVFLTVMGVVVAAAFAAAPAGS